MKIYAKQVAPEYQESPLFMDEWPENVFVFGNRDYTERAEKIREIENALENIADAIETARSGRGWSKDINAAGLIWYELPRDSGRAYTRAERLKIIDIAFNYTYTRDFSEARAAVCNALQLITGDEYSAATIRGCCQSDWNNIIYPSEYGREWLENFEIEYFNTGDEWRVYYDDDENSEFYIYTHAWNDDGRRVEIADAAGVDPADVVLYVFNGYIKTAAYKEVYA